MVALFGIETVKAMESGQLYNVFETSHRSWNGFSGMKTAEFVFVEFLVL